MSGGWLRKEVSLVLSEGPHTICLAYDDIKTSRL